MKTTILSLAILLLMTFLPASAQQADTLTVRQQNIVAIRCGIDFILAVGGGC